MNDREKTREDLLEEVHALRQRLAPMEGPEGEDPVFLRHQAQILEQIHDAVIATDLQGFVTSWNRGAERLFGYRRDEILGRHVTLIYREEDRGLRARQVAAQLMEKGNLDLEKQVLRKSGEVFWVHNSLSMLRARDGSPTGMIGFSIDVTARKQAEEALRQTQKIEAIGRLAGGVAHDFNNLLTVILGFCQVLLQNRANQGADLEALQKIHKAALRAAGLTRQLLAFGRKQIVAPVILNLNSRIEEIADSLKEMLDVDIHFDMDLDPALGNLKADPGQLDQVLFHLLANARDAMPQGGNLILQTRNVHLADAPEANADGFRPGPFILLSVRDTGHGMSAETRRHLFEPFFTTKEVGEGTGLGLSTVHGIVKQSRGHIVVDSTPGSGTSFNIFLPRDSEAPVPEAGPSREPAKETILLVEDEDSVRALAGLVLRKSGYTVLEAADGFEALELCSHVHETIDLLVTDVVMPQMAGTQLAEHLTALRPGLKVLYLSGYTEDTVVRLGVEETKVAFLQKPFTPTVLVNKVRDVLTLLEK